MPTGEKLCYLSQQTAKEIQGSQISLPDILQSETEAILTFSPEGCLALCELVLEGGQEAGTDSRRVVIYTPVISFSNDGWDAGPCFHAGLTLLFRRTGEPFSTWGATEKLNREKASRLSQEGLPPYASCAMIGLLEEYHICPEDFTGLVPKQDRELAFPISLDDLDLVIGHPFEIQLIPFGVIHNSERKNSPVAIVVAAIVYSQMEARPREKSEPRSYSLSDLGYNVQTVLQGLLNLNEVVSEESFTNPVDTWGTLVALYWLNHLSEVKEAGDKYGLSIDKDQFVALEALVLAMLSGEIC